MLRSIVLALVVTLLCAGPASAQRIKLPFSRQELETRAQKDSNDAAAHYNVALAYWNEKRYDDAERSFRTALKIEPRFALACLGLAYLPYARRSTLGEEEGENRVPKEWQPILEESDRMYDRAFMIDPGVDLTIASAVRPARSSLWQSDDYFASVYELYYKAFDDFYEGKHQEAYDRFGYIMTRLQADRRPDRVPGSIFWYHGLAASHLKKYDEAAADIRKLMERVIEFEKKQEKNKKDLIRVPLKTNEYRYMVAAFTHLAGKPDSAIPLYREVLTNDIGVYMAHVQLANIYESARAYDKAIEERRNAVNANPDDPSLLLDLGVTLGKANQVQEAEETLVKAMAANPRDTRVVFWLGLVQLEAKKRPEAKATLEQFLSIAPTRFERQIALAKQKLATLQ